MRQSFATLVLLYALAGCTREHDNTAAQAPAASDPAAAAPAPASDEPQQPVEHPKTTPEPPSGHMTDGTADSWRVGVAPQVDYVEGCS